MLLKPSAILTTRMRGCASKSSSARSLLMSRLGRGDHVDDVAVRGGHVHEQAGGLDVRHDRHQVERLVVRHRLDLGDVDEPAVRVAGVGDAAHDGDDDALHADLAVEAVDGADEAGGVAAGQLEVVLADALLVVGVAVEEDVDDVVLLAALEDGLDAPGLVELLVLAADAAGRGVEHDVDLAEQFVHGAGDRDADRVEGGLLAGLDDVQVVGHARLAQRARRERRRDVDDADQLHVPLQRHAVGETLADDAVADHAYSWAWP